MPTPIVAIAAWGRRSLLASGAVFALYVVNLALGRGRSGFGLDIPVPLNDVGEYLALLLSALLFTIGTLIRERVDDNPAADDAPGRTTH